MSSRSPVGFAKSRARKLRDSANRLRACRTRVGDVYVGSDDEMAELLIVDAELSKAALYLDELAERLEKL